MSACPRRRIRSRNADKVIRVLKGVSVVPFLEEIRVSRDLLTQTMCFMERNRVQIVAQG